MHDRYGEFGAGALVLVLLLLLAVALLVGLAVWFATQQRGTTGGRTSAPPQQPITQARAVLDDRLARGEIDEQEYLTRRRALESGPASG